MQAHFEQLLNQLEHAFQQKQYFLLYSQIQLCVALVKQKNIVLTLEKAKVIEDYLLALDDFVQEYHFRIKLNFYAIQVLEKTLQDKGQPEAAAVFGALKIGKLCNNVYGKVKWTPLHNQTQHTFKSYFDESVEKPYEILKSQHAERLRHWHENAQHSDYSVLVEPILGYWRALKVQHLKLFHAQSFENLILLGDDILTLTRDHPQLESVRTLGPSLLLLLQLLNENVWGDTPQQLKAFAQSPLRIALSLQQIAQRFSAAISEEEALIWFETVQTMHQSLATLPHSKKTTGLFQSYKPQLSATRDIFSQSSFTQKKVKSILNAQKQHTKDILSLLETFMHTAAGLLGDPPCDIALCVLGSTSRLDRRPYSDIEFVLLYEPRVDAVKERARLVTYLYHVFSLFELLLVRLGETPDPKKNEANAGFHLDSSSHVLHKGLWGTPEQIAQHFVTELTQTWDEPGHPWLSDESFYALLQPVLISTNAPESKKVFERYHQQIRLFLSKTVTGMSFALSVFKEEDVHVLKQWLGGTVPKIKAIPIENNQYQTIAFTQPEIDTIKKALQSCPSEEAKALAFKLIPDRDCTHVLTQESGLPLIGLRRHQAIAWACLKDVVQKSVAQLKKLQPGDTVDIKQTYYKPLAYLALNFKLYYQLQGQHPQDIFKEMQSQYAWAGKEICTMFIHTLAFISHYQIKLHLIHQHQEEEVVYQEMNTPEKRIWWAGCDLITKGIILPLGVALSEPALLEEGDWKDMAYAVFKTYLDKREAWLSHWKKKNLSVDSLFNHPLIQPLEMMPAANGWSPYYERTMYTHLRGLTSLTTSTVSACRVEGLLTEMEKVYLPESLVNQWFDAKGRFQGEKTYSSQRSQVRRVEWKNKVFYVKQKVGNSEGLMGREFAVQTLHLLLGGPCQLALGWPVRLTYTHTGVSQSYDVWVSQEVKGESLGKVMTQSPERLTAKALDLKSYSQHVVLAYLTCPEDGQPDNFKVQQTKTGHSHVVALDVGHSFVNARRVEKSKTVLNIKTMVYLLEAMAQPLAISTLTRLKILDAHAWMARWQIEIQQINRLFRPLLERSLKMTRVPQAQWGQYNRLVELSETVQQGLLQRFEFLQRWLRSLNILPTGWQLLERLDPLVAMSYQLLRGKIKTPEDFYRIDPKAYVKDPSTRKMYSSVTFKQIQQHTLTPEQIQESFQLTADYFETVDFNAMRDSDGLIDQAKQKFFFALLSATAQKAGSSFQQLNLSGCHVIEEPGLIALLKMLPNLLDLRIEHCDWFDVTCLFNILGHRYNYGSFQVTYQILCPNLKEIYFTLENISMYLLPRLSALGRQELTQRIKNFQKLQQSIIDRVLHQALRERDSEICQAAAITLGQVGKGNPKVLERLCQALRDRKRFVRHSAALALGQLGEGTLAVLEGLLQALRDSDDYVRWAAAEALGQLGEGTPVVLEGLLQALRDSDDYVRQKAAKALGQIGEGNLQVLEGLLQALHDSDKRVCEAAAKALGRLGKGTPVVLEGLLQALHDSDKRVCEAAAKALGQVGKGNPPVQESLLQALQDSDFEVRVAVAKALGQVGKGNPKVVEHLLQTMYKSYWKVSDATAEALGQWGRETPEVLDSLCQALQNSDNNVRYAAARALGQMGKGTTPAVLKSLCQTLQDSNEFICNKAAKALGRLGKGTPEVLDSLCQALQREGLNVSTAAAKALGRLGKGTPAVLDSLCQALQDRNWNCIRRAAAEALGQLGKGIPVVLNSLLQVLQDSDSEIRQAAAKALGQLGKGIPKVLDSLRQALQDSDDNVRWAATVALGRIDKESPVLLDNLREALQNSGLERLKATLVLSWVGKGNPKVLDSLRQALQNSNNNVRDAAAVTLVQLGEGTPEILECLLQALQSGIQDHDQTSKALVQLVEGTPAVLEGLLQTLRDGKKHILTITLGKLCTPKNYFKQLQLWAVDTTYQFNIIQEHTLTKRLAQHIFSFVNDKKSFQAIPCVNQEWKRWHQDFIEQEGAHQYRRLWQLPEASQRPEPENDDSSRTSFERFLKY